MRADGFIVNRGSGGDVVELERLQTANNALGSALVALLIAGSWQHDGNPAHGTKTHSFKIPGDKAHYLIEAAKVAIRLAGGNYIDDTFTWPDGF